MTQLKMLQLRVKGMAGNLAWFINIKVFLITGLIVLGSCETQESDYEKPDNKKAVALFEEVVRKTTPKVRGLIEKYPELLSEKGSMKEERVQALEKETREVLLPMVNGTKALLKSYNVNEKDLRQEFQEKDDPRIALVGLMILASESKEQMAVARNFVNAFRTVGYSLQGATLEEAKKDWVDCLIVAVGIDVVVDFVNGNVTEAIAKKAIKKIASRALGAIGAAIAVYEFGSCMGWY
ncbi:hypothetical protein [Muriicola soli]|uniref:Uncharacterized protein n=1 Tax=Muriicola soli TaxID=2507538 RepID=A0A411ED38_9FLAO|nr:hypothetical protein [Muriicola soli]QBA65493.1 hypothetical protein EQY75_13715 [Muriicola soli]